MVFLINTPLIAQVKLYPLDPGFTVEEDPETGDLMLPFTEEILSTLGWKEGDTMHIEASDGQLIIKKV
jgi:hypothetical protein